MKSRIVPGNFEMMFRAAGTILLNVFINVVNNASNAGCISSPSVILATKFSHAALSEFMEPVMVLSASVAEVPAIPMFS